MNLRTLLLLILLAALLSLSPRARPAPALAQTPAQDLAGLDIVRAAYDDLLSLFYRPLDPRDLLNAGWTALSAGLQRSGAPPPAALGALPDGQDPAFAAFASAYAGALAQAPPGLTSTTAAYDVAAGMASSVRDDHTSFLPPAVYQSLVISLGGGQSPEGAGIRLVPGTSRLVAAVAPGGPADLAGVLPGDLIVAANGKDLNLAGPGTLTQALGEPLGRIVPITVERAGLRLDLMLTLGPYYFQALDSRLLPGGAGYLRLDRFVSPGLTLPDGTEILSELDRRLGELEAQGANGLILDLRNNSGGDVLTAEELVGRFLTERAPASIEFDERGHQTVAPASGLMRRVQLPMVVLVNGGSASSSEVTASALHDAGRALLVGERTAGELASADLLPLPEGAGMELAVAEVESAQSAARIDRVGVPVDVQAADTRTAADYAAGRDPQLAAAVTALASAPQPPAYDSTPTDLSPPALETQYGMLLPIASQIPTNDRLTRVIATNRLDLTHPNEWIDANGGARDPLALQAMIRARGYRGSVVQVYAAGPELQPAAQVSIDVYATPSGAAQAIESNDFPDTQVAIASPVQLGDESVAYQGASSSRGTDAIAWRRGDLVLTVAYSDVPGQERPDTLAALAKLVDALYQPSPSGASAVVAR